VDEADDFWNAGESTYEDLLKCTVPPILSKSGSSADEVIRRWGRIRPSLNLATILSRTPSESLQFPQSNLLRFFSVILQINIRTRPNTRPHVRWVSCGSTSAALPRTTKVNSLRTITPVPTDGTAGALCSIIPYPPDRRNSHTSSVTVSFFTVFLESVLVDRIILLEIDI
jgi:hypothetical protein